MLGGIRLEVFQRMANISRWYLIGYLVMRKGHRCISVVKLMGTLLSIFLVMPDQYISTGSCIKICRADMIYLQISRSIISILISPTICPAIWCSDQRTTIMPSPPGTGCKRRGRKVDGDSGQIVIMLWVRVVKSACVHVHSYVIRMAI